MRHQGFDVYGEAPPEYGLDAQNIRTITFDLTTARNSCKQEIGGNVLWVMNASNPYAYIDVYFNDLTRDHVRLREGMQLKGVQFYRQKPIGNYIADFYCPKAKLIIEIDGSQHYEEKGIKKDKIRDEYFKSLGLKVLRFTNLDVLKNLNGVLEKIYEKVWFA